MQRPEKSQNSIYPTPTFYVIVLKYTEQYFFKYWAMYQTLLLRCIIIIIIIRLKNNNCYLDLPPIDHFQCSLFFDLHSSIWNYISST